MRISIAPAEHAVPAPPAGRPLGAADAAGREGTVAAADARGMARAYLALTKPNIVWLLLITTVPAMVVAQRGWPSTWLVAATLLGGVLTAGGANALNQFGDRDIDALMARTRGRPLPAGSVPPAHAAIFGLVLAVLGTAWLALTVNVPAAAIAAAAVAFYAIAYTRYLKRATAQNIVIGGAAGAAPPLIGWVAVTGGAGVEAVLLFLIVFAWTPPHFWSLALLLADDYRDAGVPMLPVVRGETHTKRQIVRYSWLLVALTAVFWRAAGMGPLYLSAAVVGGAGFLWLALRLRHEPGIAGAPRLFRYSTAYLGVLFLAMAVDRLLPR